MAGLRLTLLLTIFRANFHTAGAQEERPRGAQAQGAMLTNMPPGGEKMTLAAAVNVALKQLYIRDQLPNGSYPYLKPAFANNRQIRPQHAIYKGRAAHFPGSTYHLWYQLNGKRVWESVGDDASLALLRWQNKCLTLQARPSDQSDQGHLIALQLAAVGAAVATSARRLLSNCAAEYIAETAEHKYAKTLAVCNLTILSFCESATGVTLKDAIGSSEKDRVRKEFLARIVATGSASRTSLVPTARHMSQRPVQIRVRLE